MNYTITDIVKNELCTGCGICTSESASSKMLWNNEGFLVPDISQSFSDNAIKMCPFNPSPDAEVQDEDKLAEEFYSHSKHIDKKIGRFENTYVGYAKEYRDTSSSGGVATFVFEQLLKQELVNHLFVVKEVSGMYQYQWFDNEEQIKQISKTRYIPVTLENLFKEIDTKHGTVAVSGVACFVKAIRLKQHYYPQYKEKIPFVLGIICGGLKSSFYTDYLAQKAGIVLSYYKQEYRIKDHKSQASDYSFGAFNESKEFKQIKMRAVGDMWGTGLFKSNACDFCDDVTTELADISVGDAWLNPYNNDGRGNSVVVTRSTVADDLIKQGIDNGELQVAELPLDHFLISQQGSFNHRHIGQPFRIKQALAKEKIVPQKRYYKEKSTFDFRWVQKIRMFVRRKSIDVWKETKDANDFDSKMKSSLFWLRTATRFYHHKKRLMNKISSNRI